MIEVATQIPVPLGCLLLIGGLPLAPNFTFPLAFLVISLPPPGWLLDALTVPLQRCKSALALCFVRDGAIMGSGFAIRKARSFWGGCLSEGAVIVTHKNSPFSAESTAPLRTLDD